MGREIRRVPPNWEHPRYEREYQRPSSWLAKKDEYIPLHVGYEEALEDFAESIEKKGLSRAIEYHGGGPLKEDYVDYNGQECTWYQAYETVSEGTPVSPPFSTEDELIDYLVNNGDFWYQRDSTFYSKPSRAAAEKFVNGGWAVSMTIKNGVIKTGIETAIT
jgi:hypothetical protein